MKKPSSSENALICIGSYRSREEAGLIKGLLEANNIKAMVTADDAGGMYAFPLSRNPAGVGVYVRKEDKEKVQKII